MEFQQKQWRSDPRSLNFSHDKFFGTVALPFLPPTLNRKHVESHHQQGTLRCTGYGSAHNGEYIEGIRMSPDWQAAKVGQKQGRSVDDVGGSVEACMKAQRDCGFLPEDLVDVSLATHGVEGSGMTVWPKYLDLDALDRIPGFVHVDGPHDTFDNIRVALFKAYHPTTGLGACVDAFSEWFHEWTPSRIIPSSYASLAGSHRYIFTDWVTINGIIYLVAQNSYGQQAGDHGYHLFPRDVVNREFSKRNTALRILKVLSPEQVALGKQETVYGRIQRLIIDAWYLISEKFGAHA